MRYSPSLASLIRDDELQPAAVANVRVSGRWQARTRKPLHHRGSTRTRRHRRRAEAHWGFPVGTRRFARGRRRGRSRRASWLTTRRRIGCQATPASPSGPSAPSGQTVQRRVVAASIRRTRRRLRAARTSRRRARSPISITCGILMRSITAQRAIATTCVQQPKTKGRRSRQLTATSGRRQTFLDHSTLSVRDRSPAPRSEPTTTACPRRPS